MSASAEVAEAFGLAPKPVAVPAPAAERVRPEPVAVPAVSAGARVSGVLAWLRARAATVRADFAGAWPWRGHPPTFAELVANLVPDRDRVPGRNGFLWVSWAAFNVAMLPVFAVAYPVLWWLAHPARFVLAAMVAAALYIVWI